MTMTTPTMHRQMPALFHTTSPQPNPRAGTPGRVRRLLVVDDEESIRDVLKCYFEARRYHVMTVGSAEVALATLDLERVDLAIVDLVMPGMDGFDLLEVIRDEHPRLP